MIRNYLAAGAAALCMALGAAQAHAGTYTGTRSVDGATVSLSITTDGTLGVLAQSNVTAWDISIVDQYGSFELTDMNSAFGINGDAFTATATGLYFDFDAVSGDYALFQTPYAGSGQQFYCLETSGCYEPDLPGEGVLTTIDYDNDVHSVTEKGLQLIAGTSAAPEPGTWALMMAGVGLAGMSLRSRRRTGAVAV